MKNCWIELHFEVHNSFWGTCSLGQSWFSSDVTWDNDCSIPHYDCTMWERLRNISNLVFLQNFGSKSSAVDHVVEMNPTFQNLLNLDWILAQMTYCDTSLIWKSILQEFDHKELIALCHILCHSLNFVAHTLLINHIQILMISHLFWNQEVTWFN